MGVDDRDGHPCWLDARPEAPAENLLVFQNCLVDVGTRKMSSLTPALWAHGGVDFVYDPPQRDPA